MEYVEALAECKRIPGVPMLFLAGGITGCPDWQRDAVRMLAGQNVVLLNPRRANFPIGDPSAATDQIEWEYRHLAAADAILFWFPCETLCPIVLYELGRWSTSAKPLFVGTHPQYQRRQDVLIQLRLARRDVTVSSDLELVVADVREWLTAKWMPPRQLTVK